MITERDNVITSAKLVTKCPAFFCLFFCLFGCQQLYVETADRIFIKML